MTKNQTGRVLSCRHGSAATGATRGRGHAFSIHRVGGDIGRRCGAGGCARPRPGDLDRPVRRARTAWGDPDLQGIWTNTTSTPFERPSEFGEREFLTDEEFAAAQAAADDKARQAAAPSFDNAGSTAGPDHWYEHLDKMSQRTSHVVDPPDGQVPRLTPAAERRPVIGTVNRDRLNLSYDTW